MNKKEKIIIEGVYGCLCTMSSMNPPNPANIKDRVKNQFLMYKASGKLRQAVSLIMSGEDYELEEAEELINEAATILK